MTPATIRAAISATYAAMRQAIATYREWPSEAAKQVVSDKIRVGRAINARRRRAL